MAPERILVLDEIAHAIVAACDGARDTDAIVAHLAQSFDASESDIRPDIEALLGDLSAKGYVSL